MVVVAFLNIVSSPGPGFVRLKARFGQVGDQVSQVKDPVSQGQELDNREETNRLQCIKICQKKKKQNIFSVAVAT